MHTPVFLDKVLKHIHRPQDTRYIDCTLGEGGHTQALAQQGLMVLAIDSDTDQIKRFTAKQTPSDERSRIKVVEGNFADIVRIARENMFLDCDGALMDLGLSMNQLIYGEGFSYKYLHQPLNMIIHTDTKQRGAARAADVVTRYTYSELYRMFERNAERIHASKIAKAIVIGREKKEIQTVGDLVQILNESRLPKDIPAVFQAIRMEVNDELDNLRRGLQGVLEVVRHGGTIQIITFHSIEDRIVKLWGKKERLIEKAKYIGRSMQRQEFEKSAVLRVYEKPLDQN